MWLFVNFFAPDQTVKQPLSITIPMESHQDFFLKVFHQSASPTWQLVMPTRSLNVRLHDRIAFQTFKTILILLSCHIIS